jgi:hypothetical protein
MALTPERRGVRLPGAGVGSLGMRRTSWAVLLLLLVALLAGALTLSPAGARATLLGDGATYSMQAASVAHDFDLSYAREDYDRFATAWKGSPPQLVLRSSDRGGHIAFGTPIPYALALAPFVRFAPVRGPIAANVLFLAIAALLAASTLERRLGPTAPLWIAAFVFASVTFAFTFWVHPAIFALSAVAAAFSLAYRGEGRPAQRFTEIFAGTLPGEESGRSPLRWVFVGVLLALAAAFHPLYLVLAVPLTAAAPRGRRRRAGVALAATALGLLIVFGALGHAAGGSWVPWSRDGRLFTPGTGFPAVDIPVSGWPADDGARGPATWLPSGEAHPTASWRLWGWDALFLVAGRHLGLLPYFLPLLLGFVAFGGERGRGAAVTAVLVALVAVILLWPFDLAGAGGGGGGLTLGNAFFLPLFPALWFLAARPVRPAWPLLVAVFSGLYLYPLWLAPRSLAVEAPADRVPVSAVARRALPEESTQQTLPGVRDEQQGVLWVRLLSPALTEGTRGRLRLTPAEPGEMLLGSALPLPAVRLDFGPGAPTQITFSGAQPGPTVLTPDGGVRFVFVLGEPSRRHPMWWTRGDEYLYHLTVTAPETVNGKPLAFEIVPLYNGPSAP